MFTELFLRAHGLPVGLNEWMAFLTGLTRRGHRYRWNVGLTQHFMQTEADYDAFDLAFAFLKAGTTPEIREELLSCWRRGWGQRR